MVNIHDVLAVLRIDGDHSIHIVSLQFNSCASVEIFRHRHATAYSDLLMLVSANLWLYVFDDSFLLICILCERPKIINLFQFYYLQESLTDLPVLSGNLFIAVEGCNSTPLFLEHHVHFADTVNGIRFLPDKLQIGLFL